MGKIEVAN